MEHLKLNKCVQTQLTNFSNTKKARFNQLPPYLYHNKSQEIGTYQQNLINKNTSPKYPQKAKKIYFSKAISKQELSEKFKHTQSISLTPKQKKIIKWKVRNGQQILRGLQFQQKSRYFIKKKDKKNHSFKIYNNKTKIEYNETRCKQRINPKPSCIQLCKSKDQNKVNNQYRYSEEYTKPKYEQKSYREDMLSTNLTEKENKKLEFQVLIKTSQDKLNTTQEIIVKTPSFFNYSNLKNTQINALYQHLQQYKPTKRQFSIDNTFRIKKYKNGIYFGQMKNGKKQGKGILFYQSGIVYQGNFENDAKNGNGKQILANGSQYQGQFKKGKRNGFGKFIWSNNQLYQGEWKQGFKHGSGLWKGIKGQSYIGQWNLGKADGFGVHILPNGDRYEGQYKEGLKHGNGKQKFFNGDIYVGQYQKGKFQGKGQYIYKNGGKYHGEFKNNLREGQGTYNYQAQYYIGSYKADRKNGYGQQRTKQGHVFTGFFQDGQRYFMITRHGNGVLTKKLGQKIEGYWIHGKYGGVLESKKKTFYNLQSIQEQAQIVSINEQQSKKVRRVIIRKKKASKSYSPIKKKRRQFCK